MKSKKLGFGIALILFTVAVGVAFAEENGNFAGVSWVYQLGVSDGNFEVVQAQTGFAANVWFAYGANNNSVIHNDNNIRVTVHYNVAGRGNAIFVRTVNANSFLFTPVNEGRITRIVRVVRG